MQLLKQKPVLARLLAFACDWLLIAAWGALWFVVIWWQSGGEPQGFSNPWLSQGVAFLAMTLPATLYFSLLEASPSGASLGKRALGLWVRSKSGGRLGLGRALLRNAIKFVPWELGHLVVHQAFYSGESGLPAWLYAPLALSYLLPLWWLVSLVRTGRTPYDVWAGARVQGDGASAAKASPTG